MLSRTLIMGCLAAWAVALAGCQTAPKPEALGRYEFQSGHMGTLFSLILYAPDKNRAEAAAEAAFRRIAELENTLSDYQADSELNQLREKPVGKPIPVSRDLFHVLRKAQEISSASGGAFDVTIGPLVRQWRFSRKRKQLPSPAELAKAKASVGWDKLRLDPRAQAVTLEVPGMQLDVGGIAKGYAADEALKLCKKRGLGKALLAASGDIACGDPPPGQPGWKVGIAALGGTNLTHTMLLRNAAISTSGDSEQFIEVDGVRYSHIVSPWTGLGLTNRIQASVVAPNATLSDALATAVCVCAPESAREVLIKKFRGTGAVVVTEEHARTRTHTLGQLPALKPR